MDAARGHALVRGLDHHGDAAGLQHLLDGVGDLGGELFLDLQPLGVGFHDAGELADADDAAVRQVGDVGAADDRHHVVLAMAFQPDVAQQNDLVVAVGFLERAFQQADGIHLVAGEEFLIRAHNA